MLILGRLALEGIQVLILSSLVNAACECGYSVNQTSDSAHAVFTDLLETDFLHVENITDIGWTPQTYNVTPEAARGPYGKAASDRNVVPNPLESQYDWAGDGVNGGDPGLQLWVRSELESDMIPMGEVVAERSDMLYGSFRIAAKMTSIPGTCGAFFWFRNDTQEIDMEFLSKQFSESNSSVNLVLQSPQSAAAGYDASETGNFVVYPLDFEPSQEFHEYRFDWLSDRVSFYADGQWLQDMTVDLPNSPGYLMVNHWSNGDPSWSAGPPDSDAVLTVSYVKAYFNSSDEDRQAQYTARCTDPTATDAICQIPDQTTPPDPSGDDGNQTAHTYFFTKNSGQAPNQTVYSNGSNSSDHNAAPRSSHPSHALWTSALVAAGVTLFGLATAI